MNPKKVLKKIKNCRDFDSVVAYINEQAVAGKLSNSEAGLVAGIYGAISLGAEVKDIIVLKDIYNKKSRFPSSWTDRLKRLFDNCQGLLIATPVYFGDRSSYLNAFLTHLDQEQLVPEACVAGFISAGAKRNGGQETTNIFGILDCLRLGLYAVSNGPPTSQYGGTIFAGSIGSVADESFGLTTSKGTGKRVGEVSRLLDFDTKPTLKILLVGVSCERIFDLAKNVENVLKRKECIKVEFLNLGDYAIEHCCACASCPNPRTKKNDYKCIIPDEMLKVRSKIIDSDALLLLSEGENDPNFQYQIFMERTRFIRRNNFELTNVPVGQIHLNSTKEISIFPARILASFLRHNTVFVAPPLIISGKESKFVFKTDAGRFLDRFIKSCRRIVGGSQLLKSENNHYEPVGYKAM
jgi:multimeric flavodoxin WrbA